MWEVDDSDQTTPQLRRPKWLTHNLMVVSLVSLLQDAGSEMLYPVLPIFLVGVLGAPVAIVGIIEGLADGAASVSRVVAGRFADRVARRPMVAAGYGLAALSKVVIASSIVWPMVLAARVSDRIGKGIRSSPRDALIADETDPSTRGRAFGFHRSADSAGAMLGPLIGLALVQLLHQNLRPILWIAAIPACLSVLLVAFIREPKARAPISPDPLPETEAAPGPTVDRTPLPKRFRTLVGVFAVFGIANFPDALVLLRARSAGFGLTSVIGAYCLYNLVYALGSYPAGALSDRVSRHVVVGVGMLVFGVAYLGLGLATSPWLIWLMFAVYGLYPALTDGVAKAWVIDMAPEDRRAEAIGIHGAVVGATTIIAGTWAGLAWGSTGTVAMLISGSIGVAVGIGVICLRNGSSLVAVEV